MNMTMSRRRFLQAIGALGLAQVMPGLEVQAQATPPLPDTMRYTPAPVPRALGSLQQACTFFNPHEAAFIESAVARFIPADDLGPGALEAGVPYFIDQQLQGSFGLGAKWYLQGPWDEGTQEQGYQLPLSPQALYRIGIPAVEMHCEEAYGAVFTELSEAQQDEVLSALEDSAVELDNVPGRLLDTFFEMLRENTVEGFFADPAYGGNRDKAGWHLVGYPGVAAAYRGVIEDYYDRPYQVQPVGIAEVQQGTVELDDSGHAVHKDLMTGLPVEGTGHEH
ncbi:MAG: gluconate 2-dehydrogenase subunit 3 family protein [Deinococcota bacterium]|nr:gluconate 2-dehydrogenase subunit 3 family protein [Deinococcota bacterium]